MKLNSPAPLLFRGLLYKSLRQSFFAGQTSAAAAAVVIAAAVTASAAIAASAAVTASAAAAENDDEKNDPAAAAVTEIVSTHSDSSVDYRNHGYRGLSAAPVVPLQYIVRRRGKSVTALPVHNLPAGGCGQYLS